MQRGLPCKKDRLCRSFFALIKKNHFEKSRSDFSK